MRWYLQANLVMINLNKKIGHEQGKEMNEGTKFFKKEGLKKIIYKKA